MRILHAPLEIAGQAALSADGLSRLGHDARTLLMPHAFEYDDARAFRPWGRRWRVRLAQRVLYTPYVLRRFDTFHYHNGSSLIPYVGYIDAKLARRLGKAVVVEFYGAEVRIPSIERQRNPWYIPSAHDDDRNGLERIKAWAALTDGHVVVADHFADDFLRAHFEHIHVVGQRINAGEIVPSPPDADQRNPVIVHAPSDKAVKGTDSVRAAVESLRARGRSFRYVEMTGVSAHEVARAVGGADIVIDQLRLGSHGIFAVEAMAAAKPVICHISEHLRPTYPLDLPVIDATPSTIESVLDDWLHRHEDRHTVGLAGRAYVDRVHDHVRVAERLVAVYEALPRR